MIPEPPMPPADATPRMGVDAPAPAALSVEAKRPSAGCPHPGCGARPEWVTFPGSDGRLYCISHTDDQSAKLRATRKGGQETRIRTKKVMPAGSLTPDWSTPKAIRAWAEDRGGRVERGELDKRVVPQELAMLAKQTHDTELLAKLDDLELLIRARLSGS
jgi:hypothetical protein